MENLEQYLEQTQLSPVAGQHEIEKLIDEAKSYAFWGVCVPPFWVKKVARDLQDFPTQVVTVVGFPFGYQRSETKETEIKQALKEGANELDMVLNLTAFKTDPKGWAKVEIAKFAQLIHQEGALMKVIIETAYLSEAEIVLACKLCADAGVDFVKTSTGYSPEGATVENIALMRRTLPETVGIKASGGIRTLDKALAMIKAGADRIGTSGGVAIMEAYKTGSNNTTATEGSY